MAGATIALIGVNIYLYSQIDHMRTDMATTHERLMTEISNLPGAGSCRARGPRCDLQAGDLETAIES